MMQNNGHYARLKVIQGHQFRTSRKPVYDLVLVNNTNWHRFHDIEITDQIFAVSNTVIWCEPLGKRSTFFTLSMIAKFGLQELETSFYGMVLSIWHLEPFRRDSQVW